MVFVALKNFPIVKITPPQVLTNCQKNPPQQCSLLFDKVRETPKILGEKEQ